MQFYSNYIHDAEGTGVPMYLSFVIDKGERGIGNAQTRRVMVVLILIYSAASSLVLVWACRKELCHQTL